MTTSVAPVAKRVSSAPDASAESAKEEAKSAGADGQSLEQVLNMAAAAQLEATRTSKICIIDDEPFNVLVVKKHLQAVGYSSFVSTSDSAHAIELIRRERPDVILLDIVMPKVSGLDILHVMALDPELSRTPVLVLTATSDAEIKRICLGLGALDFLPKPVDAVDLAPRVRNALMQKVQQDRLAQQNARLDEEVRRRTAELATSRQEVVHCLARAAEHRDDDTGHHVVRVGRYVGVIARELGFGEEQVQVLEMAAQLHDVGKIGISDEILFKPGRLDEQQVETMRRHAAIGRNIIQPLTEGDLRAMRSHPRLGADLLNVPSSPLLMLASRIAQTHHEKWDGTGYPLGLKEKDIPIEGRMTAVADVFDALSSKRPYKEPFPREKCFEILREGRGTHFDPRCLDAFFKRSEEIIAIQLELMDDE